MTVGSLFSGIEGFGIGFEWAGMLMGEPVEILWQVEIDPWLRKKLAKLYPNAERFDDVKKVGKKNLKPVDVICGGFPCQPISVAGRRLGVQDARYLWPEMYRIVGELHPRRVIAENVDSILGMVESFSQVRVETQSTIRTAETDFFRGIYTREEVMLIDSICKDLESLGYSNYTELSGRRRVAPIVLPAAGVGAPHGRHRAWIVCDSERGGLPGKQRGRTGAKSENRYVEPESGVVADTHIKHPDRTGLDSGEIRGNGRTPADLCGSQDVSHSDRDRESQPGGSIGELRRRAEYRGEDVPDTHGRGCLGKQGKQREGPSGRRRACEEREDVPDTERLGPEGSGPLPSGKGRRSSEPDSQDVPDTEVGTERTGFCPDKPAEERGRRSGDCGGEALPHSDRPRRREQQRTEPGGTEQPSPECGSRRESQSVLGQSLDDFSAVIAGWPHVAPLGMAQHDFEPPRLSGKFPERSKWLKALGNAVVPLIPMIIGCAIIEQDRIKERRTSPGE